MVDRVRGSIICGGAVCQLDTAQGCTCGTVGFGKADAESRSVFHSSTKGARPDINPGSLASAAISTVTGSPKGS